MTRRRTMPRGGATPAPGTLDLFGDAHVAEAATERARYDRRGDLPATAREAAVPGDSPDAAVPVTALVRIAKDVLEGAFAPLWVRGEVSDFKAHRNGHWYFCLRDGSSQIRCVVWSRDRQRIPASPDDGMEISALGQLTVYTARGDMQLVVTAMEAAGDGLWRKALEEARLRLERDGLLAPSRKRSLPFHPRRVGVVTSPSGAALHDIISVIHRRCPSTEVVVIPAKVQGDGAVEELVEALARVNRWRGVDTLIVGRGGGAREDLWAFNDERVARAVAACTVPTISAVGHEVDITLCDLVADLRAATPSAAAEAAVPVLAELRAALVDVQGALRSALERRTARARQRMEHSARDLRLAAIRATERRRAHLYALAGRLHALSPLATLARGYAVARGLDGTMLSDTAAFHQGLPFDLVLRDGTVRATVDDVSTEPRPGSAAPRSSR